MAHDTLRGNSVMTLPVSLRSPHLSISAPPSLLHMAAPWEVFTLEQGGFALEQEGKTDNIKHFLPGIQGPVLYRPQPV